MQDLPTSSYCPDSYQPSQVWQGSPPEEVPGQSHSGDFDLLGHRDMSASDYEQFCGEKEHSTDASFVAVPQVTGPSSSSRSPRRLVRLAQLLRQGQIPDVEAHPFPSLPSISLSSQHFSMNLEESLAYDYDDAEGEEGAREAHLDIADLGLRWGSQEPPIRVQMRRAMRQQRRFIRVTEGTPSVSEGRSTGSSGSRATHDLTSKNLALWDAACSDSSKSHSQSARSSYSVCSPKPCGSSQASAEALDWLIFGQNGATGAQQSDGERLATFLEQARAAPAREIFGHLLGEDLGGLAAGYVGSMMSERSCAVALDSADVPNGEQVTRPRPMEPFGTVGTISTPSSSEEEDVI